MNKPSDQQGASLEGGRPIRTWRERLAGLDKPTDFAIAEAAKEEARELRAALASKASPDDQRQEGDDPIFHRPAQLLHSIASPPTEAAAAVGEVRIENGCIVSTSIKRPLADGGYDVVPQASPTASAAREGK